MDKVNFRASGNGYFGKTLNAFKIQGGKHLQFKPNATLFKERGITDLWYHKNPQSGEAVISLKDSEGNIIREFSLKQIDRIRNYFAKTNVQKNKRKQIEQQPIKLDTESDKLNFRPLEKTYRPAITYDSVLTGSYLRVVDYSSSPVEWEPVRIGPYQRIVGYSPILDNWFNIVMPSTDIWY